MFPCTPRGGGSGSGLIRIFIDKSCSGSDLHNLYRTVLIIKTRFNNPEERVNLYDIYDFRKNVCLSKRCSDESLTDSMKKLSGG